MARLRWTLTEVDETTVPWDVCYYHEVIRVEGGVCETDDPLSIRLLQLEGYELVPDDEGVVEE